MLGVNLSFSVSVGDLRFEELISTHAVSFCMGIRGTVLGDET